MEATASNGSFFNSQGTHVMKSMSSRVPRYISGVSAYSLASFGSTQFNRLLCFLSHWFTPSRYDADDLENLSRKKVEQRLALRGMWTVMRYGKSPAVPGKPAPAAKKAPASKAKPPTPTTSAPLAKPPVAPCRPEEEDAKTGAMPTVLTEDSAPAKEAPTADVEEGGENVQGGCAGATPEMVPPSDGDLPARDEESDFVSEHNIVETISKEGRAVSKQSTLGESTTDGGSSPYSGTASLEKKRGLSHKTRWRWFTPLQSAMCLLPWLATALAMHSGEDFFDVVAGLDSFWPGQLTLRFHGPECQDYRLQVYRWFVYQFTHVGFGHVFANCFILVVLALPLEDMHGSFCTALLFNAGVVGGACQSMLLETHAETVGCSAGVYALIGVHFVTLLLNWSQKRFRWVSLGLLILMVAVDTTLGAALNGDKVSFAGHAGGLATGVLLGIAAQRERSECLRCNRALVATACLVLVCWFCLSLAWLYSQPIGLTTLLESLSGEPGWCWYKQVYSASITDERYLCVRCPDVECIARWHNQSTSVLNIRQSECLQAGWDFVE